MIKSTFEANELEVIAPVTLVFLNTEIELLPKFATVNSGFPSPSRSPTTTPNGLEPVVKSTFEANELEVIAPVMLVFLNTETVLLLKFTTANSGFPSPSRSPMTTPKGFVPVVKSTLEANEPVVIAPMVPVFLNTETEVLL